MIGRGEDREGERDQVQARESGLGEGGGQTFPWWSDKGGGEAVQVPLGDERVWKRTLGWPCQSFTINHLGPVTLITFIHPTQPAPTPTPAPISKLIQASLENCTDLWLCRQARILVTSAVRCLHIFAFHRCWKTFSRCYLVDNVPTLAVGVLFFFFFST